MKFVPVNPNIILTSFCKKSRNCSYESACWHRYSIGTWELCKKSGIPFCLKYKRKWWKFWVEK